MNKVIRIYTEIHKYLVSDFFDDDIRTTITELSQEVKISVDTSCEYLRKLKNAIEGHSPIDEVDECQIKNDFIKGAMKDLSNLRNEKSARIFSKLKQLAIHDDDTFLWARIVRHKSDGSGMIALHTSDLEQTKSFLEKYNQDPETKYFDLQDGIKCEL